LPRPRKRPWGIPCAEKNRRLAAGFPVFCRRVLAVGKVLRLPAKPESTRANLTTSQAGPFTEGAGMMCWRRQIMPHRTRPGAAENGHDTTARHLDSK